MAFWSRREGGRYIALLYLLIAALALNVVFLRTQISGEKRNDFAQVSSSFSEEAQLVRPDDFIRSSALWGRDQFTAEFHTFLATSSVQLEVLRINGDHCDAAPHIAPTTCLQATLTGSYPQIKSLLNDLQSRHPQQLILRGLRMQRRDAALGTVTAELDLLLLGAGKAAEGATPAAEAVRAAP